MGNTDTKLEDVVESKSATLSTEPVKPKCKACCACPETKKPRDEWYLSKKMIKLINKLMNSIFLVLC